MLLTLLTGCTGGALSAPISGAAAAVVDTVVDSALRRIVSTTAPSPPSLTVVRIAWITSGSVRPRRSSPENRKIKSQDGL
jgi:hypothetical protein